MPWPIFGSDRSEHDATGSGLRERLAAVAANPLPTPGHGLTDERFRVFYEFARHDIELARLAEAHHDAHAIATDLGESLHPGVYGVWAASGPTPLTAFKTADGYCVSGVVPWCTGLGLVDRALVAAVVEEGEERSHGLLLDINALHLAPLPTDRPWISSAFASTGTASVRFEESVPPQAAVGEPGAYFCRPGFWHGAIGVAACWAGGLRGILDRYTEGWRRTDGHSLARLASAHAWADTTEAVLMSAATDIDATPNDLESAEARARAVRHVIERACSLAMDDLAVGAGPEPLAFDPVIVARTQQLQLYLRQCHGARDLEPLGRAVIDGRDPRATNE